ncbi:DUF6153 family protein [Nocardia veterana]|nr:DUF6153 family protein [Nocardia veterana]
MARLHRAPGFVRMLGVATLLIGVAVMHTVVFSTGHAMGAASEPAARIIASDHAAHAVPVAASGGGMSDVDAMRDHVRSATSGPRAVADDPGCDGCTSHASFHACVFVLVTTVLGLALAVVAWLGAERITDAGRLARVGIRRRNRPPPWTVPSLADLAILRI